MNRILLTMLLLSVAQFAKAGESPVAALTKELKNEQQARKRWQQLVSDLKTEKKVYDPKIYVGKEVLFNGSTVKLDGQLLDLVCGQTSALSIHCFVTAPKDWIDPSHPIHADTYVLEVAGTVTGMKPESLEVSIKATRIKLGATE